MKALLIKPTEILNSNSENKIFTSPALAKKEVDTNGWAILRGPEFASDIFCVSKHFGSPVSQDGMPGVNVLTPKPAEAARKNTTSSIYGLDAFPPHTDMAHCPVPPRYILLRSRSISADVPTLLIDSNHLTLSDIEQLNWRRSSWKIVRVHNNFLSSIFFNHKGRVGIRWDECTMRPYGLLANSIKNEVKNTFEKLLKEKPISIRWVNDADVLIIDNWRMLHARPAVPYSAMQRELERVLVNEIFL